MGDTMKPRSGQFREVDLLADAHSLPFHAEVRGSRFLAAYSTILALVLGCISLLLTVAAIAHLNAVALVVGSVFAFLAVTCLLGGAKEWILCEKWEFTADSVECRSRGLRRWNRWSEALSAYQGVRAEVELQRAGKHVAPVYLVELKPKAAGTRPITLYASLWPDRQRGKLEQAARLFHMPASTVTSTGLEERQVGDLDKSVRERVAEGILPIAFDPASIPPGKRLAVRVAGDALVLLARSRPLLSRYGCVVPLLVLGGAAVIAVNVPGGGTPAIVSMVIGVFLLVMGLLTLIVLSQVREELVVSPREVRKRWRHPWGTMRECVLPADRVEEVIIQALPVRGDVVFRRFPGSGTVRSVQVRSDSGTIQFGARLSQTQQIWVRDCIIAVISK
jgi:hypothetical protein